ncbi:MAG: (2Fe-2S)-binding protein [Omnitrophica WOR_2 bacterium RIFCSPHIGHO2_02_FULL_50_17]|nr:MAG: (2Fe-2S)-binding protein [Omnitrophica WOR_2 bacterium RIFCSPHIGHO2_02_FULL_50_17]
MSLDLTVVNLGGLDQIAPGQGRCFVVEGEEVAVFRPRSGGIFALGHRCPHRQGPLADGIIGEGKVVCPLHGHKFDLSTGQGSEPSERAKVFKAWEENGHIFIQCGKETAP